MVTHWVHKTQGRRKTKQKTQQRKLKKMSSTEPTKTYHSITSYKKLS